MVMPEMLLAALEASTCCDGGGSCGNSKAANASPVGGDMGRVASCGLYLGDFVLGDLLLLLDRLAQDGRLGRGEVASACCIARIRSWMRLMDLASMLLVDVLLADDDRGGLPDVFELKDALGDTCDVNDVEFFSRALIRCETDDICDAEDPTEESLSPPFESSCTFSKDVLWLDRDD